MKLKHTASHEKGYSLVELLIVISISALLTALGIVAFGLITDSAKEGVRQRNAQNLAMAYSAAIVSGHDFAEGKNNDLTEIARAVSQGKIIQTGLLENMYVGVPGMSENEIADAIAFLDFTDGRLVFKQIP